MQTSVYFQKKSKPNGMFKIIIFKTLLKQNCIYLVYKKLFLFIIACTTLHNYFFGDAASMLHAQKNPTFIKTE